MPISFMLQTDTSAASMTSTIIMMVLIFVIFYFFIIRPQNKKQKETEKMIAALKKGDKIITIGGIHGTVAATKEQTVIVKVDDNTKMEFSRSAISSVVSEKKAEPAEKKPVEKKNPEAAPSEASDK